MFDFEIGQQVQTEGIYFKCASTKTIDTFIKFDGDPAAQIGTQGTIRYCSFDAIEQSNANAKLISISPTALQNHENYYIGYCDFYCSNGIRGTAVGTAIYNGGNNGQAKHNTIEHVGVNYGAVGIDVKNGSVDISHVGGGGNGIGVRIQANTEPCSIDHYEAEGDLQAIVTAASNAPVTITNLRGSNSSQTNSGGFLKLDGLVQLNGGRFEDAPPVGGTLIEDANTGNLRLFASVDAWPNAGVTLAQVGLTGFNASSRYLIAGTANITNASASVISNMAQEFGYVFAGGAGQVNPFQVNQTWNDGALTFTGIEENITDTTSLSGSLLINLLVGGVSKFKVRKDGQITSSLATGTAPLVVASTTKVANLNVDQLDGQDWSSPTIITPTIASFINAVHDHSNAAGGGQIAISTGISGLGANVAAFLATPSSSNLAAAVTGETGTNALVFGTKPTVSLIVQPEGAVLTIGSNTIAPTDSIHQVGAGLIKTITVPAGFTSGTIALIPTAAFTYDATGNILGTGTAVVGRTMLATYSSSTSKWSMSY